MAECSVHPMVIVFAIAIVIALVRLCARALFDDGAPRPIALRDTIFVGVVVPPDAGRLYVQSLLAKASVPSRIFWGIFDFSDRVECPLELQPNVRLVQHMATRMRFRESSARAKLVHELYRDEMYTLLVPHDAEFSADWDEQLVRMHATVGGDDKILTSFCGSKSSTLRDTAPTFLCLDELRGARAVLRPQPAFEVPDAPVPSLFWTPDFSFCLGQVFQDVPLLEEISCSMEATLNSIRLWTHGYSFAVPSATLFWADPLPSEQTKYRAPRHSLGEARTLSEYEAYCGVQFRKKRAAPRAFSGLSIKADVHECTCKYGSLENARLSMHDD